MLVIALRKNIPYRWERGKSAVAIVVYESGCLINWGWGRL